MYIVLHNDEDVMKDIRKIAKGILALAEVF